MTTNITSHISTQSMPTPPLTDTAIAQQPNTQIPNTSTHSAHTNGPSDKTPQTKAPSNSEAAAAYSTFREAVLKSRQPGFNSPTVSEEKKTDDILSRQKRSDSPTPSNREGASEANDLFDALYPPTPKPPKSEDPDGANDLFNTLYPPPAATPAPKPAPPENGVDEKTGADALYNTLLAKDRRINAQVNPAGDSQLATTIANTMLGLKDSDLEKPSPMVNIPKDSTLGKWLVETNNAFMNKALVDWVKEKNIDPSSLSYDSGKKVLYGKTTDNEVKSFTQEEFPNIFSKHANAFIPLEEISKKMDPTGNGVILSFRPTDKAPLDFVQNFYGLSINNKDISSIHQAANDLSDNNSFPERAGFPDRSDEELIKQKELTASLDEVFGNLEDIESNQGSGLAIEVSNTGSAS